MTTLEPELMISPAPGHTQTYTTLATSVNLSLRPLAPTNEHSLRFRNASAACEKHKTKESQRAWKADWWGRTQSDSQTFSLESALAACALTAAIEQNMHVWCSSLWASSPPSGWSSSAARPAPSLLRGTSAPPAPPTPPSYDRTDATQSCTSVSAKANNACTKNKKVRGLRLEMNY